MEIKKFWQNIIEEFWDGVQKALGWTIPVAILSLILLSIKTYVVFPEFQATKIEINMKKDLSKISPDNSSPAGHEAFYLGEDKEPVIADWHGVPVLEITIEGKGLIQNASLFYYYSNGKSNLYTDNPLLQQSVTFSNKLLGFYFSPYKLESTVNLVNYGKDPFFLYLGVVSKENKSKYVYVVEYTNENKGTIYSEQEIAATVQFDRSKGKEYIGLNKDRIQQDITKVKSQL